MKIVLQHLTKKFPARGPVRGRKNREDVIAVNDFDFEIPDGKLIGLLGPSGCGKSTALNLICGLLKPTEGKIFFGEDDVTGLPPENRGVGMVFQNYALYPHLTVEKNIQFPLENLKGADKLSKEEMSKRVLEAAKLVQIDHLLERKPNELSGGQQQRVAIARALVLKPKVLLLDEPLAALDLKLRKDMQQELKNIQKQLGITFVFVTHDQEEALSMSDTVVVMNEGRVQQIGTPIDIYNEPQNAFVADFIGESNILDGVMKADYVACFSGKTFTCVDAGFAPNEDVDIVVRPEDVDIVKPDAGMLRGVVTSVTFLGVHFEIIVDIGGFKWMIQTTDEHKEGEDVGLYIEPDAIHVMKKSKYSGKYGDYSSYSDEIDTLNVIDDEDDE